LLTKRRADEREGPAAEMTFKRLLSSHDPRIAQAASSRAFRFAHCPSRPPALSLRTMTVIDVRYALQRRRIVEERFRTE
jgi:hypothetical protein